MNFRRIIIIDMASLGMGEASDANRYDSIGADTIGHLDEEFADKLRLPTLESLGFGNIRWDHELKTIPMVDHPKGFFGKMHAQVEASHASSTLREMFDYSEPLRIVSIFNSIARQGFSNVLISRFVNYLENQDVCKQVQCASDDVSFIEVLHHLKKTEEGIIYNQVPGLATSARQGDANDYVSRLMIIDKQIQLLMDTMLDTDLLMITSSFAKDLKINKPTTREYLPIILYANQFEEGHSLGIRRTLGDVATTVMENFTGPMSKDEFKHSLLHELAK
ncbi:phosphopentomutase [Lactobacillus sp. Sy-1]|uniref:phosphopentomutase n=1 Tax=Lactobacillus sp. Sy-1 TaxID=2109645 RepID=UPI001C593377|nr:phosphopentomutase [Lactobacillus sp. Sy-1]MBW1604844.1 phosphopentomutase [Lactobacillus sp. Sy-1]